MLLERGEQVWYFADAVRIFSKPSPPVPSIMPGPVSLKGVAVGGVGNKSACGRSINERSACYADGAQLSTLD